MKNFRAYEPEKYNSPDYTKISEGIYEYRSALGYCFVTSLSFEQEPELGEGSSPAHISQYPLEELLDEYGGWVEDFYSELNKNSDKTCYHEFASFFLVGIESFRELIGKRVTMPVLEDGSYGSLTIE